MLHRTHLCPRRLKSLLSATQYKRHVAQIQAFAIATGHLLHGSSISGNLIASYGRIGEISHARKLFDQLPQRSVSVYNSMVLVYSRGNKPDDVLRLYDQMIAEGIKPDSSTFTMSIKACLSAMVLERGEMIWSKAVEFGYQNDVFVCSSVLNLYIKCGKIEEAEVLFGKMTKRDLVCWTTMVTGFAQAGKSLKAVEFYRGMQNEGFGRDGVVMLGLLQASADLGDPKMGRSVHGFLIRTGLLHMNVVVETSVVDMYVKVGFIELASRMFSTMMYKTAVSWGSLISGFAQNGLAEKAFDAVVEMQSLGFKPDLVALVGVLLACSQVGSLKTGRSIHCYILRRHVLDRVTATALMDMYSKCGVLSSSREIFEKIGKKDLVCWNTMISCYGIHGNGEEVVSMFHEMTESSNVEPDHATFASFLSALSHLGLVEQGQDWFRAMVNRYKIQPSEKHYVCLIDLLARSGRVEEALDVIHSEKLDNALPIWVALLSGCINHTNLSVGDIAANKILELNPDSTGIQTLVSNFFATAKKWKEVAKVRKLMRSKAMEKVPGYSVIEVNGQLRTFLMEDLSHHEHYHMLQVLRNLNSEMKKEEEIEGNLKRKLENLFDVSLKSIVPDELNVEPSVAASRNRIFGDYQCDNAMGLCSRMKQKGLDIGQALIEKLPSSEMVESCSVTGPGFINVVLSTKWMAKSIEKMLINGIDTWAPTFPVKRVVVDFCSPNIAKTMHVGHIRSTIIGDTIARMLEYSKVDVLRINHVGDWGTQFGMLIEYLFEKFPGSDGSDVTDIQDLQLLYRQSKERFDKDPVFKEKAQRAVVRLQGGDPVYVKPWLKICEISRTECSKVINRLQVDLEEKGESFYKPYIANVIKELDSMGLVEEHEGARVIRVKGFKVPLMLVKRDGGFNYDTTDMAALWYRLNEEKAEWIIYVTDDGQQKHFDTFFQAAREAGWLPKDAETYPKVSHVPFGVVLGEDHKRFRSRDTDIISLTDLLDEAKTRSKAALIKRGKDKEWTLEELDQTAEAVGYGAVKYADLRKNRTTSYSFSYDQMLSDKGDTAVYLLYTHTRIYSIIQKSGKDIDELKKIGKISLDLADERALGLLLLQFAETVEEACTKLLPNTLCEYLYDLSEHFTKFYTNCKVNGSAEETSRLLLCEATAIVMRKCFHLLGITPVYKM